MLMSADLPLPERVFGHGFLTKDGKKMGKSQNNTLNPFELIQKYGSDAVRYYFIKEIEFGVDGDFSETRFINVLNAELANDLGNLLNRTLKMAHKYFNGQIPKINGEEVEVTHPLKKIGISLGEEVTQAYASLGFTHACEAVLILVRTCNKYIDETAPWSLYKQGQLEALAEVLYSVLESVRVAAYLLSPIIPNISNAIYQQLGFSNDFNNKSVINSSETFVQQISWGALPGNQLLGQPQPIFQRIDMI